MSQGMVAEIWAVATSGRGDEKWKGTRCWGNAGGKGTEAQAEVNLRRARNRWSGRNFVSWRACGKSGF